MNRLLVYLFMLCGLFTSRALTAESQPNSTSLERSQSSTAKKNAMPRRQDYKKKKKKKRGRAKSDPERSSLLEWAAGGATLTAAAWGANRYRNQTEQEPDDLEEEVPVWQVPPQPDNIIDSSSDPNDFLKVPKGLKIASEEIQLPEPLDVQMAKILKTCEEVAQENWGIHLPRAILEVMISFLYDKLFGRVKYDNDFYRHHVFNRRDPEADMDYENYHEEGGEANISTMYIHHDDTIAYVRDWHTLVFKQYTTDGVWEDSIAFTNPNSHRFIQILDYRNSKMHVTNGAQVWQLTRCAFNQQGKIPYRKKEIGRSQLGQLRLKETERICQVHVRGHYMFGIRATQDDYWRVAFNHINQEVQPFRPEIFRLHVPTRNSLLRFNVNLKDPVYEAASTALHHMYPHPLKLDCVFVVRIFRTFQLPGDREDESRHQEYSDLSCWNIKTGQALFRFRNRAFAAVSFQLPLIVTLDHQKNLTLLPLMKNKKQWQVKVDFPTQDYLTHSLSADGHYMIITYQIDDNHQQRGKNEVELWSLQDPKTGLRKIYTFSFQESIIGARISHDSIYLLLLIPQKLKIYRIKQLEEANAQNAQEEAENKEEKQEVKEDELKEEIVKPVWTYQVDMLDSTTMYGVNIHMARTGSFLCLESGASPVDLLMSTELAKPQENQ